jgi:hypothetical protein
MAGSDGMGVDLAISAPWAESAFIVRPSAAVRSSVVIRVMGFLLYADLYNTLQVLLTFLSAIIPTALHSIFNYCIFFAADRRTASQSVG